ATAAETRLRAPPGSRARPRAPQACASTAGPTYRRGGRACSRDSGDCCLGFPYSHIPGGPEILAMAGVAVAELLLLDLIFFQALYTGFELVAGASVLFAFGQCRLLRRHLVLLGDLQLCLQAGCRIGRDL